MRRGVALGVVLGIVVSLVGCGAMGTPKRTDTPRAEETSPVMTPEEAKQEIEELYELTRDAVSGDWDYSMHTWTSCETSEGRDGGEFNIFSKRRGQPLRSDPESVAKMVEAIWADHGHPVKAEYSTDFTEPRFILSDPAWLAGSGPEGLLVQFTVGDDYADFGATSRCVAGDVGEMSFIE
jgi:hypothetical protein